MEKGLKGYIMDSMKQEFTAISKWQSLKRRCSDKGLSFNLTVAQIKKLQASKTCFFTGVEFTYKPQGVQTFDRLEPSLGYVHGNVVVCTQKVNLLKADLTFDEIEKMYLKLKSLKGK